MKHSTKIDWRAFSLAGKLGYTIAIPLVLLAIGGRLLDHALGSSPILLLVGIFFSIGISSIAIWKTVAPILDGLSEPETTKDTESNKKQ